MDMLYSPRNQFFVFLCFWIVICALKWRDAEYLLLAGFYALLLWAVVGAIVGVSSGVSWGYYGYITVALIVGYAVYVASVWIADEWAPCIREGWIGVVVPLFMLPVLLALSAFIKFIIKLF